jgi:hypothetical protein
VAAAAAELDHVRGVRLRAFLFLAGACGIACASEDAEPAEDACGIGEVFLVADLNSRPNEMTPDPEDTLSSSPNLS